MTRVRRVNAQVTKVAKLMNQKHLLVAAAALWAIAASPRLTRAEDDHRATVELDVERGAWVEVDAPEPGTAAGDLHEARALNTAKHYHRAARAIKKWIKTYGTEDVLYPEAALLKTENRIARRDYYKAHKELQEFLSSYSGTEYEDKALTQEFLIAEVFLGGTRRKVWGMRMLKADDIGIAILDDITVNHPGTTIGELATMTKANYYYETGDFDMAEHEYNQLVQDYGRSRYTRPALLQGARAALASFGGVRFDDAPLIEADDRFRKYMTQYPGSAEQDGIGLILTDIQETRAAKELDIGEYYERADHLGAAKFYYQSTRTHWPESRAAITAAEHLERLGESTGNTGAVQQPAAEEAEPKPTAVDNLTPSMTRDDPAARE